ncbi:MAG: hypothetical protein KDI46_02280 [Alphaproteobacteria bacterium]|nr:hypothetical protein [Alphaproteobacteria bacterium]
MKLGGRGRVAMPQPLHARFRQAGDRRRYIIFPMRDPLRLCIMSDTQADFFRAQVRGPLFEFPFRPDRSGVFALERDHAKILGVGPRDSLVLLGAGPSLELYNAETLEAYMAGDLLAKVEGVDCDFLR